MLAPHRTGSEGDSWGAVSQPGDPLFDAIDPNGNLAQKTDSTGTWTYTWNAENQLVRVTKDGAEVAAFAYDAFGRRAEKIAGGVTTSYVYDGADILREVRGPSTFKYVGGPAIDEPLAREDGSGALTYYHGDALGSTVSMSDQSSSAALVRRYDAWGNLHIGAEEPGYAFTGREWGPETGLYYYRARYYDPTVGRFVSEDPATSHIGHSRPSQALRDLHPYVYVGNSPPLLSDPGGLQAATTAGQWGGKAFKKVYKPIHTASCSVEYVVCVARVEHYCDLFCKPSPAPGAIPLAIACLERRECCWWAYARCMIWPVGFFLPDWEDCDPWGRR